MRRLVKASLINGFLLILAIGSWVWFLYGPNSILHLHYQAPDFLGRQLPEPTQRMNVWIDRPNLPAAPGFKEFEGKEFGPELMRHIELQIQFYTTVAMAMRVKDSLQWKRIGHIEVFGKSELPPTRLDLFETEEAGLGFQIGDRFYKPEPKSSKQFLEMFRQATADSPLKQA